MMYMVDMHHFRTLAICEFNVKGALDSSNLPVFHLGFNFLAVWTSNHTRFPTLRVLGEALSLYAAIRGVEMVESRWSQHIRYLWLSTIMEKKR